MWHKNRIFVVADVTDDQQLLDKFKGEVGTWCLCNGFRCQGYLWLNDSLSEDGAQEYAVVRESDMVQVESITISWIDWPTLATLIDQLHHGGYREQNLGVVTNRIQTAEEHGRCPLCA